MRKPILLMVGFLVAVMTGTSAGLAQTLSGSWSIQPSGHDGQVQLTFVRWPI
jgi:hypothetical protein